MANCIGVNDLKIFKKMYFFLDKIWGWVYILSQSYLDILINLVLLNFMLHSEGKLSCKS